MKAVWKDEVQKLKLLVIMILTRGRRNRARKRLNDGNGRNAGTGKLDGKNKLKSQRPGSVDAGIRN